MTGFVCAVGSGDGCVKVGFATNPRQRLGSLRCASAADLRILGVQAGDRSTEADLHRIFFPHHIRREWFRIEGVVADWIAGLSPLQSPRRKSLRPVTPHPLRAYRDANGISVAALAKSVGVTRQSIHRIENRRQEPSIALIRRLVKATDCQVSADSILAACLSAPLGSGVNDASEASSEATEAA